MDNFNIPKSQKIISIEHWEFIKFSFAVFSVVSFSVWSLYGFFAEDDLLLGALVGLTFVVFWIILGIIIWIMYKRKNTISISGDLIISKKNNTSTMHELSDIKKIKKKRFLSEVDISLAAILFGWLMIPFYVTCLITFNNDSKLEFPVGRWKFIKLKKILETRWSQERHAEKTD